MIVEQKKVQNEVVGSLDNARAGIHANGNAIVHMTNGLYSDKIQSIIRETLCNGIDAMKLAGSDDRVTFHLPTVEEPYYWVRDTGIGMSHETVMHIYPVLFKSTKQDSNDVVGAFGLGAKSPIGFVDHFFLTCYYEGEMRKYIISLAEDGLNVDLLVQEPSDEPTGTEVRFMCDHSYSDFENKAEKAIRFFDPMPECVNVNLNPQPIEYDIEGSKWGIENNRAPYGNGAGNIATLICGGVAYPVRTSNLKGLVGKGQNDLEMQLIARKIHLYADVGDVDILPTREELGYTPKTNDYIVSRLTIATNEFRNAILEDIDSQPDYWTACQRATYYMLGGPGLNGWMSKDVHNRPYGNDTLTTSSLVFKWPTDWDVDHFRYRMTSRSHYPKKERATVLHQKKDVTTVGEDGVERTVKMPSGYSFIKFHTTTDMRSPVVLIDDVGRGSKGRIDWNFEQQKIRRGNVLLFAPRHKRHAGDLIKEMAEQVPGLKPMRVSELEERPKSARPPKQEPKNLLRLSKNGHGQSGSKSWNAVSEVSTKNAYVVHLKGWKPCEDTYDRDTIMDLHQLQYALTQSGYIGEDTMIYGVRGKDKPETGLPDFLEFAKSLRKDLEGNDKALSVHRGFRRTANSPLYRFAVALNASPDKRDYLKRMLPESSVIRQYCERFWEIDLNAVRNQMRLLDALRIPYMEPDDWPEEVDKQVRHRFPLLFHTMKGWDDTMGPVLQYINVMEKAVD